MLYFRKLKLLGRICYWRIIFIFTRLCLHQKFPSISWYSSISWKYICNEINNKKSTLEWISPNCILFAASDMHVNLKFSQELRHHCNIWTEHLKPCINKVLGATDNASDYGSEDWRFESSRDRNIFWFFDWGFFSGPSFCLKQ